MALSDRIPYLAQVDRPKLKLPGGKRLAVWVILNVEEWRIENAMPRTVLSPPMGQPLLPDVPNWSWHEYGMRAGFWRQFKALTERNIPVTLAINGNVCTTYPRVASAALEAGFEFARQSLLTSPRPTAIFATNNFVAIGAMRALKDAGLRVPEDMSVVAFDDLPMAITIDPFFTVADQPAYEMGQKATELLLDRLAGEAPEGFQEIVLPAPVIVRRSSGPPPE